VHVNVVIDSSKYHSTELSESYCPITGMHQAFLLSLGAQTQRHVAYLHLLTDLDELGHLVLQFAVPLHQVGQVVLQGLLLGGRRNRESRTITTIQSVKNVHSQVRLGTTLLFCI